MRAKVHDAEIYFDVEGAELVLEGATMRKHLSCLGRGMSVGIQVLKDRSPCVVRQVIASL